MAINEWINEKSSLYDVNLSRRKPVDVNYWISWRVNPSAHHLSNVQV